jgi:hypothetical protein
MTFETIESIALARRACPRPGLIVKALLGNRLEAKTEVLSTALISAIAAMCLFNDKDGSTDVLSALAGSKQTKQVKEVEAAFNNAVKYTAPIINHTGDATRVENAGYFVSMFSYAACVLQENIKQALTQKPKTPRAKPVDAPSEVETPQNVTVEVDSETHSELLSEFNTVAAKATENAEKIRALTADLAVKSAALKNAETQIELLKRQLEGQKLTNYGLKTRAKRLRALATGYKNKAQKVNNKPTRAAKSHIKA